MAISFDRPTSLGSFDRQFGRGMGAFDPSASDAQNALYGAADGAAWGESYGAADGSAGKAYVPPMSINDARFPPPTGTGSYDDAYLSAANASYAKAYSTAASKPLSTTPTPTTPTGPGPTPVVAKTTTATTTTKTPEQQAATKSNTAYWIVGGILAVATIGGVAYLATRKKPGARRRRRNPHSRRRAHGRRRR